MTKQEKELLDIIARVNYGEIVIKKEEGLTHSLLEQPRAITG